MFFHALHHESSDVVLWMDLFKHGTLADLALWPFPTRNPFCAAGVQSSLRAYSAYCFAYLVRTVLYSRPRPCLLVLSSLLWPARSAARVPMDIAWLLPLAIWYVPGLLCSAAWRDQGTGTLQMLGLSSMRSSSTLRLVSLASFEVYGCGFNLFSLLLR